MKPILLYIYLFLVFLMSCQKIEQLSQEDRSIRFCCQDETKAGEQGNMGDLKKYGFRVWGRMWDVSHPEQAAIPVFEGTEVCHDGQNWIYNGLQFWEAGKTYDFWAVYPPGKGIDVAVDDQGFFQIRDFNARGQSDLMGAQFLNLESDIWKGRPVVFTFRHLLSKVEIRVKYRKIYPEMPDYQPQCSQISIYGISGCGTFSAETADPTRMGGKWTVTGIPATAEDPLQEAVYIPAEPLPVEVAGEESVQARTLLASFLIPQMVPGDASLYLKYRILENGIYADYEQVIPLETVVKVWEPGRHYIYTAVITLDGQIHFEDPAVEDWTHEYGGSVIIY